MVLNHRKVQGCAAISTGNSTNIHRMHSLMGVCNRIFSSGTPKCSATSQNSLKASSMASRAFIIRAWAKSFISTSNRLPRLVKSPYPQAVVGVQQLVPMARIIIQCPRRELSCSSTPMTRTTTSRRRPPVSAPIGAPGTLVVRSCRCHAGSRTTPALGQLFPGLFLTPALTLSLLEDPAGDHYGGGESTIDWRGFA